MRLPEGFLQGIFKKSFKGSFAATPRKEREVQALELYRV